MTVLDWQAERYPATILQTGELMQPLWGKRIACRLGPGVLRMRIGKLRLPR